MSIQVPVTTTITPKRRPWGLLIDIANEIEGIERRRIGGGVTVIPLGCTGLTVIGADPCEVEGSIGLVDEDECIPFSPFGIATEETANTRDYDADYLRGRLAIREAVFTSASLAAGLMESSDPSLSSEATVATTDADLTPQAALEVLEVRLAEALHGAQGMIHVSPAGLMALMETLRFVDGQWHTPTGHVVVADAGYTDQPPEGEEAVEGVGWMYGSGPVEFLIGDPFFSSGGDANQYLDRTDNSMTVGNQRFAVTIFEPCAVYAAPFAYDFETLGS